MAQTLAAAEAKAATAAKAAEDALKSVEDGRAPAATNMAENIVAPAPGPDALAAAVAGAESVVMTLHAAASTVEDFASSETSAPSFVASADTNNASTAIDSGAATLRTENDALRARVAALESQLSNSVEATRCAAEAATAAKAAEDAAAADAEEQRLRYQAALQNADAAERERLEKVEKTRLEETEMQRQRLAAEVRVAFEQAAAVSAAAAPAAISAASAAVAAHQALAAAPAAAEAEELELLRQAKALAITRAEDAELRIMHLEQKLVDQHRSLQEHIEKQQSQQSLPIVTHTDDGKKTSSETKELNDSQLFGAWSAEEGAAEVAAEHIGKTTDPAENAPAGGWGIIATADSEDPSPEFVDMAAPQMTTKPAEFVPAKELAHVPMQTDLTAEVLQDALQAYQQAHEGATVSAAATSPMTPEPDWELTQEQEDVMTDLHQLVSEDTVDGYELVEALEKATAVLSDGGRPAIKMMHLNTITRGVTRLSEVLDEQTRLSEETAEATAKEQATVAAEIRTLHGQFKQLVTERDAYRATLEQMIAAGSGGSDHGGPTITANPLRTAAEERLAMWLGEEAAAEAVHAALPSPIPIGGAGALASELSLDKVQTTPSMHTPSDPASSSPPNSWHIADPSRPMALAQDSSDHGQASGTRGQEVDAAASSTRKASTAAESAATWESARPQQRATGESSAAADRLVSEVTEANAKLSAPVKSALKENSNPPAPLVDAAPDESGGLLMTGGTPAATHDRSRTHRPHAASSKVNHRLVRFTEANDDTVAGGSVGEGRRDAGGGTRPKGEDTSISYRKSWQEPTPPAAPLSPRTRERPRGSQKPPPERQTVISHRPSFNPSEAWERNGLQKPAVAATAPPEVATASAALDHSARTEAEAASSEPRREQQPEPPRTIAGAQPVGLRYVRSKRDGKLRQKTVAIDTAPAPAAESEIPDYVKERQRQKNGRKGAQRRMV